MGLPDRLRLARKRAGLSQRQTAELAGAISVPTISHIEAGGRSSIDIVERLAAGLGVPVYWLAFGPEAHLPFAQVQVLKPDECEPPKPQPSLGLFRERFRTCAERVRQVRAQQGFTLKEVAEGAQCSHQAVQYIEAGVTVPRLKTLEAIAVALNVSPGWLAYGDEPESSPLQRRKRNRGAQFEAHNSD